VIISLFGWHLVFGTKYIKRLPSPEMLAFSTYAVWSEQWRIMLFIYQYNAFSW